VRLLEECQLIKKDASGKYVLTESAITTGDRTSNSPCAASTSIA
jgi:hypothetical protein